MFILKAKVTPEDEMDDYKIDTPTDSYKLKHIPQDDSKVDSNERVTGVNADFPKVVECRKYPTS